MVTVPTFDNPEIYIRSLDNGSRMSKTIRSSLQENRSKLRELNIIRLHQTNRLTGRPSRRLVAQRR